MKNIIRIIGALFFVLILFSCGNEADPVLEIYVSAKKSELYQSVAMNHGYIKVLSGENAGGTISNYFGADVYLDLTSDVDPILVGNVTYREGIYIGLNADLGNISAISIDGDTINANTLITAGNVIYGEKFELLLNEKYRIDFIYDIDQSILIQETQNTFDTVVEVNITQL